uniref:Cysteine-rich venom protein n=1 Tax=Hemiscolopendra marginata TaxID=943146 RepID=A0A646QI70_9MYRI
MKLRVVIAAFVALSSHLCLHAWGCTTSERGMDEQTKKLILDLHNKARQKVATGQQSGQPSASNMKELRWDDEIAANAQRVAEKCIFKHTPKEQRKTSKYQYLGENIYMGSYPDPIPRSVSAWYGEVKDVNPAIVKSFASPGGPMIGHYTQVAWAETEAVGCGYVRNADDRQAYVFCQYGPGGNILRHPMYKEGSPASECKSGKSSKYQGLCN